MATSLAAIPPPPALHSETRERMVVLPPEPRKRRAKSNPFVAATPRGPTKKKVPTSRRSRL
jgi:hypothetical protein